MSPGVQSIPMISAVILSHNDQNVIQNAIASVAWCDEIVVVDDESTDKTREMARNAGANVLVHALRDDFAAQRNFAVAKARGEWVLFLDSDEIVSSQLASEIREEINTAKNREIVGYYLSRRDTLWGRELTHGETAHVKLLRLARRDAGKWIRPVHEVWDVRGPTKTLMHPLKHFPHPDVAQFISEINRYSSINARVFHQEGKRSTIWHIVAYPVAKFFLNYVLRLGFADGTPGAIVAFMMSFHSFLTRAKLYLFK